TTLRIRLTSARYAGSDNHVSMVREPTPASAAALRMVRPAARSAATRDCLGVQGNADSRFFTPGSTSGGFYRPVRCPGSSPCEVESLGDGLGDVRELAEPGRATLRRLGPPRPVIALGPDPQAEVRLPLVRVPRDPQALALAAVDVAERLAGRLRR